MLLSSISENDFYHLHICSDRNSIPQDELNPQGLFNFRFEFACGNNENELQGSGPELHAFKTMLEEFYRKLHFLIQNGNWLYERPVCIPLCSG